MAAATCWRSSKRRASIWLLLLVLALAVGLASCDDGTIEPEQADDATEVFPGLTVSDPEGASSGGGTLAATSLGLAYVSACPHTFTRVKSVTITNLASGKSLNVSVEHGGFDPVALEAEPGDEIEFLLHYLDTSTSSYLTRVPARRRPRIVRTVPPKGATDVVLSTTVAVVFSEPVDASTVTMESLQLQKGNQLVGGTLELSDDGLTAEFTPAEPLELATIYTFVITTGVLDLQGDPLEEEVEVTFSTGSQIVSVSAGNSHTCAVAVDGAVFCWGWNERGQCGRPPSEIERPQRVPTTLRFTSLALGNAHTCGVTVDGEAYCWGWNWYGQLGDGTTTDSNSPVLVSGGHSFVSMDAGTAHTCGVTTDGVAYCWGRGDFLQLGPGLYTECTHGSSTFPCSRIPLAVGSGFESLTGGSLYTCGLKTDGTAYCWGGNTGGNLGSDDPFWMESCLNDAPCSRYPLPVTGGHSFVDLSASTGWGHTCGVTTDGTAYCWGRNEYGQLGADFISEPWERNTTPLAVVGGQTFVAIHAGSFHTCGLRSDGQAFCWGSNDYRQLGNGEDQNMWVPQPVEVTGSLHFELLTSGSYQTCGLAADSDVYCWGANEAGQLGRDPTDMNRSPRPLRVPGLP